MPERRILRIEGGQTTIATETRFESELKLQEAISQHPTVLPSEDLGLGPLVTLANELDLGHGPIDLLAVDPQGRLVIVEFKRGTENPDVRKVVAQVLDYGSSLWQLSHTDLEHRCMRLGGESLVGRVERALETIPGVPFDADAFTTGVAACLETGNFVFLYVGRDMDARTRRIMTYLAEGPRMTFFAVEVDYFRSDQQDHAVLVPRTAFVPSWVAEKADGGGRSVGVPLAERLTKAPEGTVELMSLMDAFAEEFDLEVANAETGRVYRRRDGLQSVGIYATSRGAEFNLKRLRDSGNDSAADAFSTSLSSVTGRKVTARDWPAAPCAVLVANWDRIRREVLGPYFGSPSEQST